MRRFGAVERSLPLLQLFDRKRWKRGELAGNPARLNQMSTARSASKKTVRKKTAQRKTKLARPLRKDGQQVEINKLVCRYRGSEDLAPSFIKRRDRRCRKCLSKRYGSAARARKAKAKK